MIRLAALGAWGACTLALLGCVTSGGNSMPGGKASPKLAARYNTELAINYMKEGRLDQAQRKLARAVKEAPEMPAVHNALALYYQRIGQPQRADQEFQQALHYAPNSPDTLNNYGTFLCQRGRYRASLKYFTRAAENLNYGTPDAALANAGMCALKIPDKKLARRYFKRSLAINPDMGQALWQLGLMDFESGHYSSANRYLSHLVGASPNPSARLLWVSIETAWALGDRSAAQRYGRVLLKRHPKSQEAKKFIQLIGASP